MTSTQVPPMLIGEPYDRPPLDAHSADHAQPPRSHDAPQQPSMHMMAYLSTHTHLTHGQTVSGPMAPAGLMAAHHLHLILTHMHPQLGSSPHHQSDLTTS